MRVVMLEVGRGRSMAGFEDGRASMETKRSGNSLSCDRCGVPVGLRLLGKASLVQQCCFSRGETVERCRASRKNELSSHGMGEWGWWSLGGGDRCRCGMRAGGS